MRVFDFNRLLATRFMGEVRFEMRTCEFPVKGWFSLNNRGRDTETVRGEVYLKMSIQRTEHDELLAERRRGILESALPRVHRHRHPLLDTRLEAKCVSDADLAREKFELLREQGSLRSGSIKAMAPAFEEAPTNATAKEGIATVEPAAKPAHLSSGMLLKAPSKSLELANGSTEDLGMMHAAVRRSSFNIKDSEGYKLEDSHPDLRSLLHGEGESPALIVSANVTIGSLTSHARVRDASGDRFAKPPVILLSPAPPVDSPAPPSVLKSSASARSARPAIEKKVSFGDIVEVAGEGRTAKDESVTLEGELGVGVGFRRQEHADLSDGEESAVSEETAGAGAAQDLGGEKAVKVGAAAPSEEGENVVSESSEKNVVSEDSGVEKNVVSEEKNVVSENVVSEDSEKNVVSEDSEKNVVSEEGENVVSEDSEKKCCVCRLCERRGF